MTNQSSVIYNILFILLVLCSSSRRCTEAATTAAAKKGRSRFPALIAFGDSILDTGNNNNLLTLSKSNFPPYGRDFTRAQSTGRFCDGKIPTDLIAEGLGIKKVVPAYLDPKLRHNDLPTGVSFASGGSGLDPLTAKLQLVLSLQDQLNHFKEYSRKLRAVVGEKKAKHIISKSLVLVSAANNDIAITYFLTPSRSVEYDISTYTSGLVSSTSSFIKELYELGVRRIAVLGTLPLGCLPAARTVFGGFGRVCAQNVNQAAKFFNAKLLSETHNLNRNLPHAKIVYIDVYNPLLDLINNPSKSGFEVVDRGCCGTGIIEFGFLCNEFNPFTCPDASRYVLWDSAHPTERTYQILTSHILKNLNTGF